MLTFPPALPQYMAILKDLDWPRFLLEDRFMARGRKTHVSVSLSDEEREKLESWQRSTILRAGLVRRARIILLLADGLSITEIARRVGITRRSVYKWAYGFEEQRIEGLHDKPGRGRKPFFPADRGRACGQDRLRAARLGGPFGLAVGLRGTGLASDSRRIGGFDLAANHPQDTGVSQAQTLASPHVA